MLRDSTCTIDVPGRAAFWLLSAAAHDRATVLDAELVDTCGSSLACRLHFGREDPVGVDDTTMTFEIFGADLALAGATEALAALLDTLGMASAARPT